MSTSDPVHLEHVAGDPPVEALSALQRRAYAPVGLRVWNPMEFSALTALPTSRLLVARQDCGMPCGFLLSSVLGDQGEILSIAVDPRFRRQDIGRRLVADLENSKKEVKIKRIILEVAETNSVAIAFYETLDFKKISIRRNYYLIDDRRIDARVMEKHIV